MILLTITMGYFAPTPPSMRRRGGTPLLASHCEPLCLGTRPVPGCTLAPHCICRAKPPEGGTGRHGQDPHIWGPGALSGGCICRGSPIAEGAGLGFPRGALVGLVPLKNSLKKVINFMDLHGCAPVKRGEFFKSLVVLHQKDLVLGLVLKKGPCRAETLSLSWFGETWWASPAPRGEVCPCVCRYRFAIEAPIFGWGPLWAGEPGGGSRGADPSFVRIREPGGSPSGTLGLCICTGVLDLGFAEG